MADRRQDGDGESASKRLKAGDGSPAPAPGTTNLQDVIAQAKARAAALIKAKMMNQGGSPSPAPSGGPAPATAASTSAADKLAAIKARVAAATAGARAGGPPQRAAATPAASYQAPPPPPPEQQRGGSGLNVGLHPMLMGDVGVVNRQATGTRFGTTLGNRRTESPMLGKNKKQLDLSGPTRDELEKNPYFDTTLGAAAMPKVRKTRELKFVEHGRFIAQGAALRKQAQLEALKKRIAEQARKAGLDEDRSEQAFIVQAPPEIEWWDEGLVEGTTYPDFEEDAMDAGKKLKINTEETIVTRYIQHPVQLQPPQEKNLVPMKPLYLTKDEQKKKRRQNRAVLLKEKQAKQRLGLVPPEPPKVKKSNLMRVLGEQAVKDPTAVELRVNREIEERKLKHEQENEERKLTKEERLEKVAANREKDAAKGLWMNVYRIDSLAYGKHRYKIDINAKQQEFTGMVILNPKLNLVIVEGGEHGIKAYKKLMLNRIDWTEIAPPTLSSKENGEKREDETAKAWWLKPEDDNGQLKDLTENRCVLIWEGQVKERMFKKWSSRVCETDGDARRALERMKMENMWQTAKNYVAS